MRSKYAGVPSLNLQLDHRCRGPRGSRICLLFNARDATPLANDAHQAIDNEPDDREHNEARNHRHERDEPRRRVQRRGRCRRAPRCLSKYKNNTEIQDILSHLLSGLQIEFYMHRQSVTYIIFWRVAHIKFFKILYGKIKELYSFL